MSHTAPTRHAMNVENFAALVNFCAGLEPTRYHPVRLNLKIKALQEALAASQESLASWERAHADLGKSHEPDSAASTVIEAQRMAHVAHDRAKAALQATLYAPGEGIVDLANDCKTYLKSLKGPKEPELHHITHLEFKAAL